MKLRRLDPPGCGCTDCMTGYSKPVDTGADTELWRLMTGRLQNASGNDLEELRSRP